MPRITSGLVYTPEGLHERSILCNPEDILLKSQGHRTEQVFEFDFRPVLEGGLEGVFPTLLGLDSDPSQGDRPQGRPLRLGQGLSDRLSEKPYRDGVFEPEIENFLRSANPKQAEEENLCMACSSFTESEGLVMKGKGQNEIFRGLVGTSAGVYEEENLRLEEEIEEKLRRMLSPTRGAMMKATRSVEQLISGHCMKTTIRKNQHSNTYQGIFPEFEDIGIPELSKINCDPIDQVDSFEIVSEKCPSTEQLLKRAKDDEGRKQDQIIESYAHLDCMAMNLDDDSGDEMGVEESLMFLESFKVDREIRAHYNDLISETEVKEMQQEMGLYTIEECDGSGSRDSVDKTEPKIYFPPIESNLTQEPRKNNTMEEEIGSASSLSDEQKGSKLSRVASTWWSSDSSLAKEILQELKQAVEWFGDEHEAGMSHSLDTLGELNTKRNVNYLDLSIEQVGIVLSNISEKIGNIFYEKNSDSLNSNYNRTQLINIANILFTCLNYAADSIMSASLNDEDQMLASIEEVLDTFSFMSELLNKVPPEVRQESISVLNPPESLTKALSLLATTDYFESCFVTDVEQESDIEVETDNYPDVENQSSGEESDTDLQLKMSYNSLNNSPSKIEETIRSYDDSKLKLRHFFPQSSQTSDEARQHLNSYEEYLKLSPAAMTVEDFSTMLLLMSSVLNGFPDELKSVNFSDLNPPSDLLQGLFILYNADDIGGIADLERSKSFLTLTLQEVSDFILTVSKVFHDESIGVKGLMIKDLDPQNSLIDAVTLLTSLLQKSSMNSRSQEEVSKEEWSTPPMSQEHFFDAMESISCLN